VGSLPIKIFAAALFVGGLATVLLARNRAQFVEVNEEAIRIQYGYNRWLIRYEDVKSIEPARTDFGPSARLFMSLVRMSQGYEPFLHDTKIGFRRWRIVIALVPFPVPLLSKALRLPIEDREAFITEARARLRQQNVCA